MDNVQQYFLQPSRDGFLPSRDEFLTSITLKERPPLFSSRRRVFLLTCTVEAVLLLERNP